MRWFLLLLAIPAAAAPLRAEGKHVTFERDVWPLFNNHCLSCHGGVHQRNDLDLRTIEGVLKGGKSGNAIVPGKPEESLLWKKIHADEMPKTDNKISAGNKAIIKSWIAGGARSTRDEKKEIRPFAKAPRNQGRSRHASIATFGNGSKPRK